MQKPESSTTSESSSSSSAPDGATSIPRDNKQPVEFIFHEPESVSAELSRIKRLQHRITETKARLRKFKQDFLPGAIDILGDMAQRERYYDNRTILVVPLDFSGDNDNNWVDGGDAGDAGDDGSSPKMALLAFLAFVVETDWTWVTDLLDNFRSKNSEQWMSLEVTRVCVEQ